MAPLADGTTINRPIVLSDEGSSLLGVPGGSHARCNFIGPAVVTRAKRPGITLGPSLVPGPGYAMRFGHWLPWLDLSVIPQMDVSGLSEWTNEFWFQVITAPPEQKALAGSQLNLGPACQRISWGQWLHDRGRVQIWWGGNPVARTGHYESPVNVWSVGSVHHLATVLHDQVVRTFIDGQIVLEFASPTATVPQLPGKVEVTALGSNPSDPSGQNWLVDAPEIWIDGYRVSDVARYWEAFTPPASKFGTDPHTLLLLNNQETDPDFTIGRTTGPLAWLLPKGTSGQQIGGIIVKDVLLDCAGTATGFWLQETIDSDFDNLLALYAVHAFQCPGPTYSCSFRRLRGIASGYGFMHGNSGQGTLITGLNLTHGAVGYFANGSIGGQISGLRLTPTDNCLTGIYTYGQTALSFYDAMMSIEYAGQAPNMLAGAIIRQSPVRFFGGVVPGRRGRLVDWPHGPGDGRGHAGAADPVR
jgi:hypothetical protein